MAQADSEKLKTLTQADEEGMAAMSEKFKEEGGEIYLPAAE